MGRKYNRPELKDFWFAIIVFALLVLMVVESEAKQVKLTSEQIAIVKSIAARHEVSYKKLIRIAYVESKFNVKAVRHNRNYTMDYGIMQINSIHWTTTCNEYNVFEFEGNVSCGAKLLAMHKRYKAIDSNYVGRYHSKTPSLKLKYVELLNRVPSWVDNH